MTISMIVAMGQNNEIGRDNQLLWNIPSDLKHFKRTTIGKTVVMGRKTYESIGKSLPNRENIVLSRKLNPNIKGCFQISNINDVFGYNEDIFVIGGQQVYELFLPYIEQLYITHVDEEFEDADTYFPSIDYSEWQETVIENNYEVKPYYTIVRYDRIKDDK
jgi:dihydrofolate reductase